MGTINRFVRGLLSTLDSQVQGRQPDSFGEQILPVYSMKPGLQWSRGVTTKEQSAVAVGVGSVLQLGPPAGEVWQVHAVSGTIISLDALATTWFPAIYVSDGVLDMAIATTAIGGVTGTVNNRTSIHALFPDPWEMAGPTLFQAYIERFTGVIPVLGVTFLLRALVTVQRI